MELNFIFNRKLRSHLGKTMFAAWIPSVTRTVWTKTHNEVSPGSQGSRPSNTTSKGLWKGLLSLVVAHGLSQTQDPGPLNPNNNKPNEKRSSIKSQELKFYYWSKLKELYTVKCPNGANCA
jgi:hypothetical protein